MTLPLRAVNKASKAVLDELVRGLSEPGQSRKFDNAPGTLMAVHVARLVDTEVGTIFSVAHYYESQNDLVPDPDQELLRTTDGEWYPVSWTNQFGRRTSVTVDGDRVVVISAKQQADQTQFANMWMKNIRQQQKIGRDTGSR